MLNIKYIFLGVLLASFIFVFSGNKYSHINVSKNDLGLELIKAIRMGDYIKSQKLISLGAEVNIQDNGFSGDTPLTSACVKSHYEIVELLIKSGANINFCDKYCKSGLMWACQMGRKEIVLLLLDFGAVTNIRDNRGDTALKQACLSGDIAIVKMLLKSGVNINVQDNNLYTPLMSVSFGGCQNIFNFLIDLGANLDLKDETGRTALMIAISHGHREKVNILISKGADIYLKNKYSKTAFDLVQSLADQDLVKLLEEVHKRNQFLIKKLIINIENDDNESKKIIKKILIRYPNLVDQEGNSILHLVGKAKNKNVDLICLICKIKLGLLNKNNYLGQTPMDIYPEIILHLINSGFLAIV